MASFIKVSAVILSWEWSDQERKLQWSLGRCFTKALGHPKLGYPKNYLLTCCGLIVPFYIIDLGQHWFRWWLVAITWTSVILSSVGSCGIYITVGHHSPVASFTKEVIPQLAKRPLKTNEHFANRWLTSSVKEATKVLRILVPQMSWKMAHLELPTHLPRVNELTTSKPHAIHCLGVPLCCLTTTIVWQKFLELWIF